MKKYCEMYYTARHEKTVNKKKMYAWYIREQNGTIMCSSVDEDMDWGDDKGLYELKLEAELDAIEAIEDHYN